MPSRQSTSDTRRCGPIASTLRNPILFILSILFSAIGGTPAVRSVAAQEPPAESQYEEEEEVVSFEVSYTGDVFSNVTGGMRRDVAYLDNIDVTVAVDFGNLFGWNGASLYVYGLGNQGGDPSSFVGDAQGINNIEAVDAWRLYEFWLQQRLLNDGLSLLVGLYDLNSEFDVIQSAALFLHSSFGIGAEFASSREMGPSIFPVTSFGVRLRAMPTTFLYTQLAILDGVPGDPTDPADTHIEFASNDGALLAGEVGLLLRGPVDQAEPGRLQRARRRRVSRHEAGQYDAKFAIGIWRYTAEFDEVFDADGDGNPNVQSGNWGLYAIAEAHAWRETDDPAQGLRLFGRVGLADPDVNRFESYTGAGLVYRGPFAGRNDDEVGLAVAAAHNGAQYRGAELAAGRTVNRSEVALELTYGAALTTGVALQADMQYIIAPNTDPALANALALGLRFQYAF